MSDKTVPSVLMSKPGIKRDGTAFDGDNYQDGQWVRFQRGLPKKMGGYRAMTQVANGPVRGMLVDSRTASNTANLFSPHGIERLQFDLSGAGGGLTDRTPDGFVANDQYTWSYDTMYDSQGVTAPTMVCAATPDLDDIASDTPGPCYYGDITSSSSLTQLADSDGPVLISGGLVVIQPFLFLYGSDGLIRNADANNVGVSAFSLVDPSLAGEVNVAGTKIVCGLPIRGGSSSPSGIFWALDTLIRASFVGTPEVFRYDPIGQISVLSKKGIIEYDGLFFWAGVDRFYVYNGTIQEVPNQMNINWFFEGLNFAQRQKVWAMKVPRYGEIWWFFPRGNATECTHAVIFNVRENSWYDVELGRSAGFPARVFPSPIMAGIEDSTSVVFVGSSAPTGFRYGDRVVGATSGATGTIAKLTTTGAFIEVGAGVFLSGETVSSARASMILTSAPVNRQLDVIWQHEVGRDKVIGQEVSAIRSFFDTSSESYMTGGLAGNGQAMSNAMTTARIEPDFVQTGNMNLIVFGCSYAADEPIDSKPYPFGPDTPFIDVREERREISFRFESNELGGHYEMGKVLVKVEPGATRG